MKTSDAEFLTEKMSLDLIWLMSELFSSKFISHKPILESYISDLINCLKGVNPKKAICSCYELMLESIEDNRLHEVVESLRHAFTSYASGGLFDLYVYQSNESWYPKILLKSELKPNDILELPNKLDVYRGCDNAEFSTEKYGQSWSTSFDVAKEFAYQHYASQVWYKDENRCILKASVFRKDVFFSRQSFHEKEVAVNTERLINVRKI